MKFLILLMLSLSTRPAFSKAFFCSKTIINESVAVARAHATNDKNMHCSTSCLMALRCSNSSAFTIGILKEIKDIFGPGNAEMADLKADRIGIQLVKTQRARNKRDCLDQCDSYYTPNL